MVSFDECYIDIVQNHNFRTECFALLLSKTLGYAILVGALIVKVPQILKILNAKTAQGLSLASTLLEMVVLLISWGYSFRKGFPFSTYGETAFISVQNVVIVVLIYLYGSGISASLFLVLAVYGGALYAILFNPSDLVPLSTVLYLQTFTIPIMILSRIPQIVSNFKAKSTGQLALLTWLLNFGGSAARVFTTLQEVNDQAILLSYIIGFVLNGTVLAQILMYGNKEQKSAKKQQ